LASFVLLPLVGWETGVVTGIFLVDVVDIARLSHGRDGLGIV
jgi:hypothetical protein